MKHYINVAMPKYGRLKTRLPKKLYSYDGRTYFLKEGDRVPDGFWASYECIFHEDITAQGDTLEECRRNLALKTNLMIESGKVELFVKK